MFARLLTAKDFKNKQKVDYEGRISCWVQKKYRYKGSWGYCYKEDLGDENVLYFTKKPSERQLRKYLDWNIVKIRNFILIIYDKNEYYKNTFKSFTLTGNEEEVTQDLIDVLREIPRGKRVYVDFPDSQIMNKFVEWNMEPDSEMPQTKNEFLIYAIHRDIEVCTIFT